MRKMCAGEGVVQIFANKRNDNLKPNYEAVR